MWTRSSHVQTQKVIKRMPLLVDDRSRLRHASGAYTCNLGVQYTYNTVKGRNESEERKNYVILIATRGSHSYSTSS